MSKIHFTGEEEIFTIENPENYSGLYFPMAGEKGLKSAVTPNMGGDCKMNQETFLLEPVSIDNLHNNRSTRNFWCVMEGNRCWSATGASAEAENLKFTDKQEQSELTAGFMNHTIKRISDKYNLVSEIISFVPADENTEIIKIKIKNTAETNQKVTLIAAIPIYGRSADNIRDHRNVTSMLHRIKTGKYGIFVKPTMSFDEKGHRRNHKIYFVQGVTGRGTAPESFYPTVEEFLGEGGTFTHPRAVYENYPGVQAGKTAEGKEAMGGLKFEEVTLNPGETTEYVIFSGITEEEGEAKRLMESYGTLKESALLLEKTKSYWQKKVNVSYYTGDRKFDLFMRWVSFQPILRRIYGCSFLPHHDYGRGGRGWRDLWQDCLSLLLMDPGDVRTMILKNFGGVRIDGTNATIIGHEPGSFIADRNGIIRVWMDHAVWPFMTTKLYIDQTGDIEVLLEDETYFKDAQCMRGYDTDPAWNETDGNYQRTEGGEAYRGTVLEHLLIEHLCAFYEVGEHNEIRLRGADWNDALDMASHNGESVAFTCAYAGNIRELAQCLNVLREQYGYEKIALMEEAVPLLAKGYELYESTEEKRKLLEKYLKSIRHCISGRKSLISVKELIENLYDKAEWMMGHIRRQEWIDGEEGEGWFNSYYDDNKNAVEGFFDSGVRMMLTGQVFAIMSGTADKNQISKIRAGADHYLYEPEIGGYRLNTDFHELKFDMGRMFGFAYGEKENGAVFSHMTVMYANALYKRGFVKEGYKALQTLADTALNFETSKIYPGLPEYFNNKGRGMYHYLTGAASWYMMTMMTEVFGIHGEMGNLVMCPKLMAEQFDENGYATIRLTFREKKFEIVYYNAQKLQYGDYRIRKVFCDESEIRHIEFETFIAKSMIKALDKETVHKIEIILDR